MLKYNKFLIYNRFYSVSKSTSKEKYTETILLPQTKLPLRLNKKDVTKRDKFINNLSGFKELYSWQRQHCKPPEFVLHDGPPYANGTPHMGHALNKILKDTILRSKIIQGQKVHYTPGWDCHGLPIELKAISDTSQKLTPLEIRTKARNFAKNTIDLQSSAFQSWGVIGNWKNAYMTFNSVYIKNQIEKFVQLYEKGLVFQDVKPVHWSPSSRTALAEAELEYNSEHKSTAVIVKFQLANLPGNITNNNKDLNINALIWTTTPWTLPCNQAICFNPNLSYSVVEIKEKLEFYLVATNLIENLSNTLKTELHVVTTFPGASLEGVTYYHPFQNENTFPFLPSDHAFDSKGTGLVHTAPAHGPEDFLVALENKLTISSLVDESGCYTSAAGPKLKGLYVLSEGVNTVVDMLKENILHKCDYVHRYPYDWRTKQPVIIRASKQWFLDTDKIKHRAIELLENVKGLPQFFNEMHKNTLSSQISKRPYWCISRQRLWGVPIPVFYEKSTGKCIINRKIMNHLFSLLEQHGSDYWWDLPLSMILPNDILTDLKIPLSNLEKGEDIFDIWLDSGLSWSYALDGDQIADMYLEGVDQFTGWFQSALLTSVALRDKAPYKSIYVHGFVVDENGLKMSKSSGNVVDPLDILEGNNGMKAYGTDVLRWWVVCHASSDPITHVSSNVLQASADEVQKVRSVLRFGIGALFDYKENEVDYASLQIIDKYLLHLLWHFHKQICEIYDSYTFNKLAPCVLHFLTNSVSALYYIAIKDRLYCDEQFSQNRCGAQFVLSQLFKIVTKSIAPVVPHLAEEMYMHLPQRRHDSFFQIEDLTTNDTWNNSQLTILVENVLLNVKKELHKIVGPSTVDVNIQIKLPENSYKKLMELSSESHEVNKEVADILQVSRVNIVKDLEIENGKFSIQIDKSNLFNCKRCRRVFAEFENDLCSRCKFVCNNLKIKEAVIS